MKEATMVKGAKSRRKAESMLRGEAVGKQQKEAAVSPATFAKHFEKLFSKVSECETLGLAQDPWIPPKTEPCRDFLGPPTLGEVTFAMR